MQLDISKSMVKIIIYSRNKGPEVSAGIIVECVLNTVFIIADGREFVGMTGIVNITAEFQDGNKFSHKGFRIENGLLGVYLTHPNGVFDMTNIKKIKISDQPLEKIQSVHTYEGLKHRLTSGNNNVSMS